MMYVDGARSIICRREEEELEKAKVALNHAQRAAHRKVIAQWKPILKQLKETLKEQHVHRSKLLGLRKALCVDIRKSVGPVQ